MLLLFFLLGSKTGRVLVEWRGDGRHCEDFKT